MSAMSTLSGVGGKFLTAQEDALFHSKQRRLIVEDSDDDNMG